MKKLKLTQAHLQDKKQEGDYWDTFLKINFDLIKETQRFRTSDGYRSIYGIDIPLISETNYSKSYNFRYFTELYEDNISSFSFLLQAANSLTSDDIKLSERLMFQVADLGDLKKEKLAPKTELTILVEIMLHRSILHQPYQKYYQI